METTAPVPLKSEAPAVQWRGFAAIAAMATLNVAVHYLGLNTHLRMALHLILALVQAALVAVHSMHLVSERKIIWLVMGFSFFFVVALFVSLIIELPDAPGYRFP